MDHALCMFLGNGLSSHLLINCRPSLPLSHYYLKNIYIIIIFSIYFIAGLKFTLQVCFFIFLGIFSSQEKNSVPCGVVN